MWQQKRWIRGRKSPHYFNIFPPTTCEASQLLALTSSLLLFTIYNDSSTCGYGQPKSSSVFSFLLSFFLSTFLFSAPALLRSHNMASSSISRGLVLTTAMLVSTSVLYLAFSRQKTSPQSQIAENSKPHKPNRQILRSCLYSGKNPTSFPYFHHFLFLFYLIFIFMVLNCDCRCSHVVITVIAKNYEKVMANMTLNITVVRL